MAAMNCRNCGGAMQLIAARGYFFCRYCGSFHFPEAAGDDGIRIVGDPEKPLACGTCKGALSSAMLDESFAVHYCRNCRAILIPRASFATVVEKRRAWALDPPGPAIPLERSELDRKVVCPACAATMITHPYYGPGNVVIDSCTTCDLILLDFGELKQIVAAPGRDRGNRQVVPRDTAETRVIASAIEANEPGPPADLLSLMWRLF
jgi:Zn-finger nucleic acid-binding protein